MQCWRLRERVSGSGRRHHLTAVGERAREMRNARERLVLWPDGTTLRARRRYLRAAGGCRQGGRRTRKGSSGANRRSRSGAPIRAIASIGCWHSRVRRPSRNEDIERCRNRSADGFASRGAVFHDVGHRDLGWSVVMTVASSPPGLDRCAPRRLLTLSLLRSPSRTLGATTVPPSGARSAERPRHPLSASSGLAGSATGHSTKSAP